MPDPDIHDVTININGSHKVLTTTPREIFASSDAGENWMPLGVNGRFRLPYCRALTQKIDDPKTLFVATGDGAVGCAGGIQRSRDGGNQWEMAEAAGRAEFADLDLRDAPGQSRPDRHLQPLRRALRDRKRRRHAGPSCRASSPKSAR